MAKVKVVFYKDKNGCPVREWFDQLPKKALAKGEVRIARLAELGHELRRPEADYLRDEIYELRWRFQSVNYRILYFFYGQEIVVLSNGLTKENIVPPKEIDAAILRKSVFEKDPMKHRETEG